MPPAAPGLREPRVTTYQAAYLMKAGLLECPDSGDLSPAPASSVSLGKSLSLAEALFLVACEKDTGRVVSLPLQNHAEVLHPKSFA